MMALCRFVWNLTIDVKFSGVLLDTIIDLGIRRRRHHRYGGKRQCFTRLVASTCWFDKPFSIVSHDLTASRPSPSGGLRPALTRSNHDGETPYTICTCFATSTQNDEGP